MSELAAKYTNANANANANAYANTNTNAYNYQEIYDSIIAVHPNLGRFIVIPDDATDKEIVWLRRENGKVDSPNQEELDFLLQDRGLDRNPHYMIFAHEFINSLSEDQAEYVMPFFYKSILADYELQHN